MSERNKKEDKKKDPMRDKTDARQPQSDTAEGDRETVEESLRIHDEEKRKHA